MRHVSIHCRVAAIVAGLVAALIVPSLRPLASQEPGPEAGANAAQQAVCGPRVIAADDQEAARWLGWVPRAEIAIEPWSPTGDGAMRDASSIAITTDGRHIFVAHDFNRLAVGTRPAGENSATAAPRWQPLDIPPDRRPAPVRFLAGLALSPDEKRLATASVGGSVHVFDLEFSANDEGQPTTVRIAGGASAVTTGPAFAIEFTPDGRHILATLGDGTLGVWRLRDELANGLESVATLDAGDMATDLAISADGEFIAVTTAIDAPNANGGAGGQMGRLIVWRLADVLAADGPTLDPVASLDRDNAGFSAVTFSPDGREIFAGAFDGSVWAASLSPAPVDPGVKLWAAEQPAILAPHRNATFLPREVRDIVAAADGNRLGIARDFGHLVVCERIAGDWRTTAEFEQGNDVTNRLAFIDGDTALAAVRIFRTPRNESCVFRAIAMPVASATLGRDERLPTPAFARETELEPTALGTPVAVSPTGRHLAYEKTTDANGKSLLAVTELGGETATVLPIESLDAVSFSADGKWLFAAVRIAAGSRELIAVSVADARANAEPAIVRHPLSVAVSHLALVADAPEIIAVSSTRIERFRFAESAGDDDANGVGQWTPTGRIDATPWGRSAPRENLGVSADGKWLLAHVRGRIGMGEARVEQWLLAWDDRRLVLEETRRVQPTDALVAAAKFGHVSIFDAIQFSITAGSLRAMRTHEGPMAAWRARARQLGEDPRPLEAVASADGMLALVQVSGPDDVAEVWQYSRVTSDWSRIATLPDVSVSRTRALVATEPALVVVEVSDVPYSLRVREWAWPPPVPNFHIAGQAVDWSRMPEGYARPSWLDISRVRDVRIAPDDAEADFVVIRATVEVKNDRAGDAYRVRAVPQGLRGHVDPRFAPSPIFFGRVPGNSSVRREVAIRLPMTGATMQLPDAWNLTAQGYRENLAGGVNLELAIESAVAKARGDAEPGTPFFYWLEAVSIDGYYRTPDQRVLALHAMWLDARHHAPASAAALLAMMRDEIATHGPAIRQQLESEAMQAIAEATTDADAVAKLLDVAERFSITDAATLARLLAGQKLRAAGDTQAAIAVWRGGFVDPLTASTLGAFSDWPAARIALLMALATAYRDLKKPAEELRIYRHLDAAADRDTLVTIDGERQLLTDWLAARREAIGGDGE